MSEKRFTIDKTNRIYEKGDIMSKTTVVTMLNSLSEENEQLKKRNKFLEDFDSRFKEQVEAIIKKNEQLKEENEQLRTQLAICQQSNDDGRFKVWEVPPIPKGTRITFSTTERSGKNE